MTGDRIQTETRRRLIRLRAALLLTTVVVLVTTAASVQGVQQVAHTARDRTAQAVLEVTAAKAALVEADRAAISSFHTGEVRLVGAGADYQIQTALASQSLARVAELNEAGEPGSQTLRLAEGLLAAYLAAVSQANAHYRSGGLNSNILGTADLWDASRLLHSSSGVLEQLDALRAAEQSALATQLSTSWLHPATPAVWAVPIAFLLALLGVTQLYLGKRFRRTLNAPLLAATLLLAGLCAGMVSTLVTTHQLNEAQRGLNSVLAGWDARTAVVDADGQRTLHEFITVHCGQSECGAAAPIASPAPTAYPDSASIDDGRNAVTEGFTSAADGTWLEFGIPITALIIGGLVAGGVQLRLGEYRYRP